MSSTAIKDFLRTPKGKLLIALCAMLISWIFLFLNFSSSLNLSFPSAQRKNKLRSEIRKLKADLKVQEEALRKNKELKAQFQEMLKSCWIPEQSGDVELGLRQVIESAAKKNELKLNTLGTVRKTRINSDLSYAELDISTQAPLETIVKFISTIQENKPAISWKRLTLYTIIRRRRPGGNQSRTVTGANSENALIFSASFRVIVYEKELPAATQGPAVKAQNQSNAPAGKRQIRQNGKTTAVSGRKSSKRSGKGGTAK